MKTNRRLEIEVETVRLTVRRGKARLLRCPVCDAEIVVADGDRAALPSGQTRAASQPEADGLHLVETAQGPHYICLNSILGSIEDAQSSNATALRDTETSRAAQPDLSKE